jgi:hypothetical protein
MKRKFAGRRLRAKIDALLCYGAERSANMRHASSLLAHPVWWTRHQQALQRFRDLAVLQRVRPDLEAGHSGLAAARTRAKGTGGGHRSVASAGTSQIGTCEWRRPCAPLPGSETRARWLSAAVRPLTARTSPQSHPLRHFLHESRRFYCPPGYSAGFPEAVGRACPWAEAGGYLE